LIEVEYEVLPFVIDVAEAMAPGAPILHEDLFTTGVDPKPTVPSNIAKVVTFKKGDVEAGFKEAEVIVEGRYTTKPVHQGYIEPHACLATYAPDGQITIHASSQGHFMIRAYTAKLLGIDARQCHEQPGQRFEWQHDAMRFAADGREGQTDLLATRKDGPGGQFLTFYVVDRVDRDIHSALSLRYSPWYIGIDAT
jgi:hypothetical protein